ncbi:hypothetical protein JCM10908_000393 [Rhodotorula pacifica]|uniref:class I SAM-dependent methyltransferase n=1 Tax=Rhodotorula pacifica TaxID=1495444 RepID=UPI00317A1212
MSTEPAHTAFAKDNFSKSGSSGLYDRARPDYPQEAIQAILSSLPSRSSTKGANVLELGAGTGLFTRGLLKAAAAQRPGQIAKVTAVEPSEGMRTGFLSKLDPNGYGGIEVECVDGLFDKIPAEDASADLVVIAQAFHWVGHDGRSAVEEIARVLKPGGVWALIWNLEDRDVPWIAQIREKYERFEQDTPQYRHGYWRSIYSTPEYAQNFTAPTESHYKRALTTNEDLVVDRVFSKSYITALSETEREQLGAQINETVRRGEGKTWIDEKEGTFEYDYKTDLVLAQRK